MKRAITVWILNTAISLLFRIEARARMLRAKAEACKTRRIGGELIEITGGIGTRNGKVMPAISALVWQGELPAGFYGHGPRCPDRSKDIRAQLPRPACSRDYAGDIFQRHRSNMKRT
jgi:hypothetical protein